MTEYITKDKAKELVCEFCTWGGTSNCEECEHPVDDVPAADVAPVRHGWWILKSTHEGLEDDPEQYWECSLCGCGSDSFDTVYHTPYCPNCGAKMDKEKE